MKPWSIALFIAHAPMAKTMTYMQKFSTKRNVAIDFICSLANYVLCVIGWRRISNPLRIGTACFLYTSKNSYRFLLKNGVLFLTRILDGLKLKDPWRVVKMMFYTSHTRQEKIFLILYIFKDCLTTIPSQQENILGSCHLFILQEK